MRDTEKATDTLNSLLRGEISAVETYRQALEKVAGQPGAQQLSEVHRDHAEAASVLREHVTRYGGDPADDSGIWGTFARAVEATAKVFGDKSALKALKEGEEHGLKDYQDALKEENLPSECVALIRDRLLPKQQRHLAVIEGLMRAA
jgi:uncharacterized protein (TIGR02284 family)